MSASKCVVEISGNYLIYVTRREVYGMLLKWFSVIQSSHQPSPGLQPIEYA